MNYLKLREFAVPNQPASLPEDLAIFTHHFPGMPILPGALSAVLLSECCGGSEWHLNKIKGLRFRKPLTPNLSFMISFESLQESATEKACLGRILSGSDTVADGEFYFSKSELPQAKEVSPECERPQWTSSQIQEYLPHGGPIVLIDQLLDSTYPLEIQNYLAGDRRSDLNQNDLVGTKIHTRSILQSNNFWLDQGDLPLPLLAELAAQAGALTLAPFFEGTKPQVSLLGCDMEFYASVGEDSTIDTFVELTRVKRLGKVSNMIIFKSECFVGSTKIAQIALNAMASLGDTP